MQVGHNQVTMSANIKVGPAILCLCSKQTRISEKHVKHTQNYCWWDFLESCFKIKHFLRFWLLTEKNYLFPKIVPCKLVSQHLDTNYTTWTELDRLVVVWKNQNSIRFLDTFFGRKEKTLKISINFYMKIGIETPIFLYLDFRNFYFDLNFKTNFNI